MLADPLAKMVSSTERVDRLIRATMSRLKHSSGCVAFANGISDTLVGTRPDQSWDETLKSHSQQFLVVMLLQCNASLKSYAHRRNLEQLFKGADRLKHGSTLADGRECVSEYLRITWVSVCVMLAQMKSLFPETWAIGANVRKCCDMQEQMTLLALTGASVKICSMSRPIGGECFPLETKKLFLK